MSKTLNPDIVGLRSGHVGFISVLSYQAGRYNSDAELRQTLSSVFAAFELNATMQWESAIPTGVIA